MTRKQQRSIVIFGGLGVLTAAVALVLSALSEQVTFFRTPVDLVGNAQAQTTRVRLGGLVVYDSVDKAGETVVFAVEDAEAEIKVQYTGILPDLFREGQGIVAEGQLNSQGIFIADTVLAKHDETYMPKEVADRLKEQGFWKGEEKQ